MAVYLNRLFLSVVTILFIESSSVFAGTGAVPFVYEKLTLLPSGKTVNVTFRERRCRSGECQAVDAGMWGIDGGAPRFITEAFLVSINEQAFDIPKKFFTDLTNTYQLSVLEQDARVTIELKGGDAAGVYTARFMLGGMCGFERIVCGEMCQEIWEKNTWYNSFTYETDAQCKSNIE
jgi:hypothetical protein